MEDKSNKTQDFDNRNIQQEEFYLMFVLNYGYGQLPTPTRTKNYMKRTDVNDIHCCKTFSEHDTLTELKLGVVSFAVGLNC